MYLARFSYDVLPVNRRRAIDFIEQEVKSHRARGSMPACSFCCTHSAKFSPPPEVEVLRVAVGAGAHEWRRRH